MGEISEALRRANAERERLARSRRAEAPAAGSEPAAVRLGDAAGGLAAALAESVESPPGEDDAPIQEISSAFDEQWPSRAVLIKPHSAVAERFRHFALRVRWLLDERDLRSLLVASSLHDEGKTLVSCNLALALASMAAERRIALVDLDLRRPSVAPRLGLSGSVCVRQVLAGGAALAAARIRTQLDTLDIYPCLQPTADAHALLAGPRLAAMIRELQARYDTVVVDGPPVLLVPDAPMILKHVEACVAVVRSGVTRMAALREMLEALPADKLVGEFINEGPAQRHSYQNYYGVEGDEAD